MTKTTLDYINRIWSYKFSIMFILVTLASFFTRLWRIDFPSVVVFDEVHFVSMGQWYNSRKYFFDIHPPLGKLIVAFVMNLTGFGLDDKYREIETPYQHYGYVWIRRTQGTFGALLAPLCCLIMRELGGTDYACILSGILILLELSFQTISRAVLLDSTLYLFIGLGFYFGLKLWNTNDMIKYNDLMIKRKVKDNASFYIKKKKGLLIKYWIWTILCSFFISCAFCVKHTGLCVIGTVGVIHFIRTLFVSPKLKNYNNLNEIVKEKKKINDDKNNDDKDKVIVQKTPNIIIRFMDELTNRIFSRMFLSGLIMLFFIVSIYILCFVIHFKIIIYSGVDENSMPDEYRATLIGNEHMNVKGPAPSMLSNIYRINKRMLELNHEVQYEQYYCSKWYEWLVHYRGIVYEWEKYPDGTHTCVYLFGNPPIYWLGLVSVVVGLYYFDRFFHQRTAPKKVLSSINIFQHNSICYCLLGYFSNLLPYVLIVKRPTYVYHYHPSLFFAILLTGLLFDLLTKPLLSIISKLRPILLSLFFIFFLSVYIFFSPFSFSFHLTEEQHDKRRLFKSLFPLW